MRKIRFLYIILIPVIATIIVACDNPFAPRLADGLSSDQIISDQKTVAGVFSNFCYAYNFKDTLVYSNLLDRDFTFTYYDFENGDKSSWDKEMDMNKTNKLFQNAYKIELIWNDIWSEVEYNQGDTLMMNVNRRFTLTVYYSPTVYDYAFGNAFFKLRRYSANDPWKIFYWDDQSA